MSAVARESTQEEEQQKLFYALIAQLRKIDCLQGLKNGALPNIIDILNNPPTDLEEVGEPHQALFTSENLDKGDDPRIVTINYQCISSDNSEGKIAFHRHDNLDEIIITKGRPGYAGLPESLDQVGGYYITLVPAGLDHGSDVKKSTGEWVSIKVAVDQE